jgi:NADPH:quinone reductase-like Zn-dependent oxidoreductase
MSTIPAMMRAVQITAYDGALENIRNVEMPVPQPGPGQVLVRVAASPINPSDLMFIRGLYGFKKPLPAVPGFEGSGTVVSAGSGFMTRMLMGKRVACAAADASIVGGLWAEYVVTGAQFCIPLRKNVDLEQAAMMLVNPLTAWALVDEARKGGHKAMVQTAAASALGRMIVRLANRFGIPLINVVRRTEQLELLRSMGAEHVLNSSAPDFDSALHDLCHKLGATIGFDAVAGETTMRAMRAQPRRSRMLVYGALSLEPSQTDPGSLIFDEKRLEGFWLSGWLRGKNLWQQLKISGKVQGLLGGDLRSEVQARWPLTEAARALQQYSDHMTAGKVLILPGAASGNSVPA